MRTAMVRYKVKAEKAAENENYIARVFEQLKAEQPAGLHYASFTLEDGVSFVHISALEGAGESNPLGELAAFKAFTTQIKERCEELPVVVELKQVGSYHLFDEGE
jgi:hypothetical protein